MENNNQEKSFQISAEYCGNQQLLKLSVSGDDKFVSEKFKEITENNKRKEAVREICCWREITLLIFIVIGFIISFLTDKYDTFYWPIALAWSGFLGLYAFQIHRTGTDYEKEINPIKIHQFVFNFGGAIIGWIIVYNLMPIDIKCIDEARVILLIIAGISFTGYLPKVITLFKN